MLPSRSHFRARLWRGSLCGAALAFLVARRCGKRHDVCAARHRSCASSLTHIHLISLLVPCQHISQSSRGLVRPTLPACSITPTQPPCGAAHTLANPLPTPAIPRPSRPTARPPEPDCTRSRSGTPPWRARARARAPPSADDARRRPPRLLSPRGPVPKAGLGAEQRSCIARGALIAGTPCARSRLLRPSGGASV